MSDGDVDGPLVGGMDGVGEAVGHGPQLAGQFSRTAGELLHKPFWAATGQYDSKSATGYGHVGAKVSGCMQVEHSARQVSFNCKALSNQSCAIGGFSSEVHMQLSARSGMVELIEYLCEHQRVQ